MAGSLPDQSGMSQNRRDQRKRPTPEEIRALLHEAVEPYAEEILHHMYDAMLKTPEFALKNGMKCRVDPFYAPEVGADGNLKCGFDIQLENGAHLEFTVGHTGGGKSFVGTETQRMKSKGSGRQP